MEITNKPLREHYEDCNGQLAVFNYIEDLEKHIDYLVKLNLPVVSRSLPTEKELTSEIERQIKEYKKEQPYLVDDAKDNVLEIGYRKCYSWLGKW